jgi:molybdopterin converting factor small subunit
MAMRIKKRAGFGVALLAAFLMPGLASAHEEACVYSESQDDIATHINALKDHIHDSNGFTVNKKFGVSRDQVGLEAKAVAALSKALEEKYGDSIAKLEDMMANVNDLLDARKTKLDEADGDDILYLTELAYNCVLDVQMERLKQP